jgi:predicted transcriptional regulator
MSEQLTARVEQDFLARLDEEADRRGMTRSEFVRETLLKEIERSPDRNIFSAATRGLAVVEAIALVLIVWPLLPIYVAPGLFDLSSFGGTFLVVVPPLIGGVLLALVLGVAVSLLSYFGVRHAADSQIVKIVSRFFG